MPTPDALRPKVEHHASDGTVTYDTEALNALGRDCDRHATRVAARTPAERRLIDEAYRKRNAALKHDTAIQARGRAVNRAYLETQAALAEGATDEEAGRRAELAAGDDLRINAFERFDQITRTVFGQYAIRARSLTATRTRSVCPRSREHRAAPSRRATRSSSRSDDPGPGEPPPALAGLRHARGRR